MHDGGSPDPAFGARREPALRPPRWPRVLRSAVVDVSATALVDATTFAALGEPSRLRIVELLRDGPLSVGEIVALLGIRQPQVSKHLRVLGESGIVAVQPRHRQRIYRLRPEQFDVVAHWVDSFEQLWETRLESLDAFLQTLDTERNDGDEQADR